MTAMKTEFVPDLIPAFTEEWMNEPEAELIVFRGKDIFLCGENGSFQFPRTEDLKELEGKPALRIGTLRGVPCYAANADLPDEPENGKAAAVELRFAVGCLKDCEFAAVSRARELLHWRIQHRFCGRCGGILKESETDTAMVCPDCGERFYPQLAPAVIVGITNGSRILLAHNKKFRRDMHGLIAGFVEAGENIEQAIRREIREETGIEVDNIRYFASQCWPFPNSLMLGYTAEYVSGAAEPDGEELDELGWYQASAMPEIPGKGSIARRIIDDFIQKNSRTRSSEPCAEN